MVAPPRFGLLEGDPIEDDDMVAAAGETGLTLLTMVKDLEL